MGIFKRSHKGGFADVIRCDVPNYLIWKWHPDGYEEGRLKRENAIRTTSVLRVKPGEVAVFFYKQKDGKNIDYIVGPYDDTLKTQNFPVLSSIIGLWYEGDTPFQAEVFFINTAQAAQIKFGIPYFDVIDPRYPDFQVPVSVRGTLTFKIEDYVHFIECHQLATFDFEQFKEKINGVVNRYIKDTVTKTPSENNIPVIAIESKIDIVSEKAELYIKERLAENYGITVTGLDISSIEIDKESESYLELKHITKDITTKQAEINIQHYEEQLRIQREEGQYAQRMATRQANIGAYQTEKQAEVGVASAEALGKMGENGAGNINLGNGGEGTGGAGFNPMTLMAGLAVGGAVAKNIGGTLDQTMNSNPAVPPALPKTTYHVAIDGKAIGPFEASKIQDMIATGEIKNDTLIWKQGTPSWQKASDFGEFSSLFPPVLP
ncbi:MAG: SPFH domain-containing protein [Bacilli bacterium]|nr:SPFH domain-containing protein [Bacilli bacterium]